MYSGIYIETMMSYTYERSLMVLEQIETTPAKGTESRSTIYALLKTLKQLIFDGFANKLSKYTGQSSSVGLYISDMCFKPGTNYTPQTFFTVVKYNHVLTVHSDTVFSKIDDIDKIDFSYDKTCKIFENDPTIKTICDIERNFWKSTKTRADTIKLLKEFEPVSTIKWYNFTRTLKQRCRRNIRHKIINILAKDIKDETHTKTDNNTSIV